MAPFWPPRPSAPRPRRSRSPTTPAMGLAASVWSENINLALDIAPKLAAGIVWVNGTNMMDAAAGFGGVRESGFGREGGWEGLAGYTKPKDTAKPLKTDRRLYDRGRRTPPTRWTAPPSSISAANRRGPTAAIPAPSIARAASCWAMHPSPTAKISATRSRPAMPPKAGPRPPAICARRSCIISLKTFPPGRTNLPPASTR